MSDEKTYNQIDSTTALKVRKQPQPGDVLDKIYRLEKPLGKGGVGIVYRAWHLHLQRPCAIKFLHPQLVSNSELRTRFRREAQSAFQLGHPHIVAITDFRDDPEAWPYLVMELVEGETLRDRLERGPLPPVLAVRIMAELCDALNTAHRRGVIHRDLKPENLFLTRVESPGPGEPDVTLKVLDFGLSKLLDGADITGTGRLLGSPSYMSPEQARGDSHLVDARSDIFAVGALLYECLVGDKLWNVENFDEKRQMIIAARLPPLKLMERGMPPQLEKIISKACARLPEDRYPTASRLMEALNNVYPSAPRADTSRVPVVARTADAAAPVSGKAQTVDATSNGGSVGGGEIIPGGSDLATVPVAVQSGANVVPPKRKAVSPAVVVAGLLAVAVIGVGSYSVMSAGSRPTTTGSGTPTGPTEPTRANGSELPHEPPVDPVVKPQVTALGTPQVTPVGTVDPAVGPEPVKLTPKPLHPGVTPLPPGDPRAIAAANNAAKWKAKWKPGVKPGVPGQPVPPTTAVPHPVAGTPGGAPAGGDSSTTEKAVPSVNVIMRTKAVPAILRCYPAGSAGPSKFSVDITVGADGKVSEANVDGGDDQSGCILGVLRGLHFAPSPEGDYSFRWDFAGVHH